MGGIFKLIIQSYLSLFNSDFNLYSILENTHGLRRCLPTTTITSCLKMVYLDNEPPVLSAATGLNLN
jgi:hypothetical protein